MAIPAVSESFGDLLDIRFQDILDNEMEQLSDMLPTLFNFPTDNGRADMRWSQIGAFGDFTEFTGSVIYDDVFQGFDVTATHIEFASGFQVERKLFDDDQYNVMDQKPSSLAESWVRTRQQHGAQVFVGAFSASNDFYNHTEGVALCSDSHTTTADGVSTATGFDNLATAALSMTAVTAARIQMRGFKDDRGGRMSTMGSELWFPVDLFDVAKEILEAPGNPESANRTVNVHGSALSDGTGRAGWEYMSDVNDWFLVDPSRRRKHLHWVDRVALEFAFAEDLDTLVAKWRAYGRYSWAWVRWDWILGSQVS